ncbi:hypothetical protein F5884DRAFT_883770 [Xylogone sp. PMI_703]|nr:hypothetical protein F5884DRAFT_883770 [Xylogone sp. PMI_703]
MTSVQHASLVSSTSIPATTSSSIHSAITLFPAIPLTTTFVQPSDCAGIYSSPNALFIDPSTSCLPSGFNPSPTGFFSPGIVCPSGYVTACHDTLGVSTITTITCCPSYGEITLSCAPDHSSLQGIWSTLFCTWVPTTTTTLEVTQSSNGITSTGAVKVWSPGGINAYGIRMVHENTDISGATPSSTSASTINTNSTTIPGYIDFDGSDLSSGLSTGGKVAIGITVPVGILAILAGVVFWLRKNRQSRSVSRDSFQDETLSESMSSMAIPVFPKSSTMGHLVEAPADRHAVSELQAPPMDSKPSRPSTAVTDTLLAELPGSTF